MTHPEHLLGDYVDGTLPASDRAVVDAHLTGCARCREEVRLASDAVRALGSLTAEPVPFGVTEPVLAEADHSFERRRAIRWQRLQWSAGLAAAAALVLVVVLNTTGQEPREAAPAAGAGGTAAASPQAGQAEAAAGAAVGLERQAGVDYDDAGILAVASDAVAALAQPAAAPGAEATLAADARLAFAASEEALSCVARSGGPTNGPRDRVLRLIRAVYNGTPAYIAVFAQSPGAGQPADHVVVWVVATEDCRILTTASKRLP